MAACIDALSVQETYFWREVDQLRALTDVSCRACAAARRAIRIWSVPCATGEEPLSIAMALRSGLVRARADRAPRQRRQRGRALRARAPGRYGSAPSAAAGRAARALLHHARTPANGWRARRFTAACRRGPGQRRAAGRARARCRRRRRLLPESLHLFPPATVRQVVEQLRGLMPSPGYLCVGASESLLRLTTPFELEESAARSST